MQPYRRRLACLLVALLAIGVMVPSAAAERHDPRHERERVRQRRAQVATQVDALKAEDAEVEAALEALNAKVASQQALLADAQRAVEHAERQVADARAAEARTVTEIAELEGDIRDMAVQAYMGRGQANLGASLLDSSDLNEAARRSALTDAVFGNAAEAGDRLRAAREDLAIARQQAEEAAAAANERRTEVSQRLRQVKTARDQQAGFADEVEARIEARLAEASSLAQLDSQLSAEIVRRQEALARRNRGSRGVARGGSVPTGNVPLRNVRGIWVHESIADRLEGLLSAAEGDGLSFGGGGYRDPGDQQRLREANCPDPYSSPASSCRPPTARPGQSMHERGLAVDFTYQGRIVSSRSSPAYQWLDANASRFGLYNLPSEPWHWSTNGN